MSRSIIVIVLRGFRESTDSWDSYQTQAVVSVTGLTSPRHKIRKELKKEFSEETIKQCCEGQNFYQINICSRPEKSSSR
jgi:hypothetical protein